MIWEIFLSITISNISHIKNLLITWIFLLEIRKNKQKLLKSTSPKAQRASEEQIFSPRNCLKKRFNSWKSKNKKPIKKRCKWKLSKWNKEYLRKGMLKYRRNKRRTLSILYLWTKSNWSYCIFFIIGLAKSTCYQIRKPWRGSIPSMEKHSSFCISTCRDLRESLYHQSSEQLMILKVLN